MGFVGTRILNQVYGIPVDMILESILWDPKGHYFQINFTAFNFIVFFEKRMIIYAKNGSSPQWAPNYRYAAFCLHSAHQNLFTSQGGVCGRVRETPVYDAFKSYQAL